MDLEDLRRDHWLRKREFDQRLVGLKEEIPRVARRPRKGLQQRVNDLESCGIQTSQPGVEEGSCMESKKG